MLPSTWSHALSGLEEAPEHMRSSAAHLVGCTHRSGWSLERLGPPAEHDAGLTLLLDYKEFAGRHCSAGRIQLPAVYS